MFFWPRLSVAIIVVLLVMEPTLPSVLATHPSDVQDTGFAIPTESASPTLAKSSSSTLSSECSSSAPSGVLYEVPISLTNSQSSPTPSPFQQQLRIDSSLFSQYEASDLRNVEFYELDGSIIPSWLESGNSNSLMNTVYWLRLPNGIPALSTLTICMGFGASNLQFVNLGKTGEAPQLSGTYAQYDNGGTVFNFYDNFAGTALSSQWTTSYSCRQSGSTTYSCSPNQNCNSVGCSLDNVQISVNNAVKLTGPSGGVQGGMITTSSFSQPEFVDYYQLSYYSPGGSPSIIVEQSTGNSFGTDGFDYGYGPNVFSPTRADIQSFNDFNNGGTIFFGVNSGVGHMPSFSLPAVLSFAWMGTGSETGMVNYGSPTSLADSANSFGPFYLSVLDSGGGNYAATGTLQWIRLRAVPPNGVMPACMLVAPDGTPVQCGGNQTVTSVSCNSPVLRGSSTTCTVKVTGSSPTGDASFSDGGTGGVFVPANAMCTLSSGVCSVSYSVSANFGIRPITATYLGDSNNAGSSAVFSLDVVQLCQSNTYINCLSNTVSVGQGTVCTAYVTGYNPATGTISWSQSSSNGGSVSFSGSSCQLNDGSCPITVTGSSSGAVSITANYGGDTNNLGSSYTTGQANSLTVTPGPPPPTIYSVTITSGNGGMIQWSYTANSGTVPSGHTSTFQVVAGVQFSLSAIPSDSQHYFQSWSAYGSVTQSGTSASITLTPSGDGGIVANFGTIASAALVTSVASGKGSISPNCPNGCSEAVGSSITVTATPNSGWQFSGWSAQIGVSCSSGSCTFNMPNGPVTLTANFVIIVSSPFRFSISVSPGSGIVQAGGTSTGTVSLTLTSGSSQSVSLTETGLPGNVGTISFGSPSCSPTCQSSFSIRTFSTAPAGSYSILVTGTGGGLANSATYILTVTAPSQFVFSISNSGGITVNQGSSGSSKITVTLTSGSTQSVGLSCSGLPSGASCLFNPISGSPTFSSTLTLTVAVSTPTGTLPVTVTAVGGGKTYQTQFTLTVISSTKQSLCGTPQPPTDPYSGCLGIVINSGYLLGTSTSEGGSVTWSAPTSYARVNAPYQGASGTVVGGTSAIVFVPPRATVSLTASPQFSFTFHDWSLSDTLSTGVNPSSSSINIVTNGNGCLTADFSPTLSLRIIASCLPIGTWHDIYSTTLSATGGTPPYVWSGIGVQLSNTGLTLSSTGVLSGTLSVSGPLWFDVQVTDSAGSTAMREFMLFITQGVRLQCPTSSLGASLGAIAALGCPFVGKPNKFNSFPALQAVGGAGGYSFFLASPCCLPSALVLNPSTGVISGTPTSAGIYPFAVGVRDNAGAESTLFFDLIVPPVVTGVTPQSGQPGTGGGGVTISGIGFTGATSVSFGTQQAQNFHVASDSEITTMSPPQQSCVQQGCVVNVAVTVGAVTSGGYCLLATVPGAPTCYQFVYLPRSVSLRCSPSMSLSFPTQTLSYSANQLTTITGSLGLTSTFNLCIAVQDNNIQKLTSTATFNPSISATLSFVAGHSVGPVAIGPSYQTDPVLIPVGAVPIVIVPTFTPVLSVGAYAGPSLNIQLTSSPSQPITITYAPAGSNSLQVQLQQPTCKNSGGDHAPLCFVITTSIGNPLSVSATAAIGVDITLELYGLAGPSIIPQASLAFSAGANGGTACDGSKQTGNWWAVCAGLNVGLGGTVAPPGWLCPNCFSASAPITWEGPQAIVTKGSLGASLLSVALQPALSDAPASLGGNHVLFPRWLLPFVRVNWG